MTSYAGMTFEVEVRERNGSPSRGVDDRENDADDVDVDVATASRSTGLARARPKHKAMFATARPFHCC